MIAEGEVRRSEVLVVARVTPASVLVPVLLFLAMLGSAVAQTSGGPTTVPAGTPGAGQYELDERTARMVQVVVRELQAERGGSWFDRHTSEILILVGTLLGVIIGAVVADRLALRRDRRRDETARKALADALYQELLQLAIQCYGGCDQMEEFLQRPGEPQIAGMQIGLLRSFKLPRPTIFEESSSQLGTLPSDLVQRLVAFHSILAFSREDVARWDSQQAGQAIPPRYAKTFAERWFALRRLAADALEELCRFLGLPKASIPTQPDQDLVALLRERAGPPQEAEGQQ